VSAARLLSLLTIWTLFVSVQAQQAAKDVFRKASPSVVVIIALDSKDQPQALGSGFAVGEHLLATNFHVIHNASKLKVFTAVSHEELTVTGVKGIDNNRDLALIETSSTLSPLKIKTGQVEVGEAVYVIGNPRGLDATLSSGLVSALRNGEDPKMYQVTAPISPGSSGGPVMTSDIEVIGVATSYLENGQNLNFAVQGQHLQELISSSSSRQTVDVASCSGADLPSAAKPSVMSVRIVKPTWYGDSYYYKMTFNLSVANDGDKKVTAVDVLILLYDEEGKEMLHAIKRTLRTNVDPNLAERQEFEVAHLGFDTDNARKWQVEFRVLSFKTK